MSQNALLDRDVTPQTKGTVQSETQSIARLQREHLTLIDWELASPSPVIAPANAGQTAVLVIPAHRRWFGWSEAATGLLLLAAGAACLSSLLSL